jgi:hypothetical protein
MKKHREPTSVGKTSYHKCRVVNRRVASRYSTFAT